jgi:membrane protease subunit HflK
MDAALSEERDQIAPRVRALMQIILDRYKVGVEIVAINLQQGGVRPPEQVQASFDDVLKAGQERERAKNEAQAYANDVIPRAVGAASRLKEEADAYKSRVVAQAQGDAQRFRSVYNEYQKAPQVTRDRMYLDTMQQIYGNVTKVLVESRQGSSLLYLPLEKLLHGAKDAGSLSDTTPALSGSNMPAPAGQPNTAASTDIRSRDAGRSRERDGR